MTGITPPCPIYNGSLRRADLLSIDKDEICPICLDKFTNPVRLVCRHIYCDLCIRRHLARQRTCPLDMGVVRECHKDFRETWYDLNHYWRLATWATRIGHWEIFLVVELWLVVYLLLGSSEFLELIYKVWSHVLGFYVFRLYVHELLMTPTRYVQFRDLILKAIFGPGFKQRCLSSAALFAVSMTCWTAVSHIDSGRCISRGSNWPFCMESQLKDFALYGATLHMRLIFESASVQILSRLLEDG
jgi:hypothetical protein